MANHNRAYLSVHYMTLFYQINIYLSYEKCLLTDLDGANTLYADGNVTVILAREMTRAYSDVNLVPTADSGVLLQNVPLIIYYVIGAIPNPDGRFSRISLGKFDMQNFR